MFLVLHRYIFRELLRVFILTTVALTLILSLGSILRPIQEHGVGPQQIVRLLVYFLPVTLTFVLPMAALFASTLSYGRLSGDNEIDACKASGVSPLTLVYPGFILALLVAMGNLGLSFYVMPLYIHKAEEAIKADARQILFRKVQQQGYYSPPGNRFSVYADYVNPETNILSGVIAVQARNGLISEIYTTEDARVSFKKEQDQSKVRIDAYNVREVGRASDLWVTTDRFSSEIPFGSLLADKISFKKVHELKQIQANPLSFRPITEQVDRVRELMILELMLQDMNDVFAAGQRYALSGDPNTVRLSVERASLGLGQIDLSGAMIVQEIHAVSGKTIRTLRCMKGALYLSIQNDTPTLSLDLENVSSTDRVGIIMRYRIRRLQLPARLQPYFKGNQLRLLLADNLFDNLKTGPSLKLNQHREYLASLVHTTLADIQSEVHSRLVFGLGCIPMILIGIGLGIIKRGGHMLSAFGASCIPGLVLVVAMVSGKQLTENTRAGGISGVVLIWSGLAILWMICAFVYRKLIRN